MKLAVRVADTSGGIDPKVVWQIDGRTKGETTAPGLAGPPSIGLYVVMEQTLPIDPGSKNEIRLLPTTGPGCWRARPCTSRLTLTV